MCKVFSFKNKVLLTRGSRGRSLSVVQRVDVEADVDGPGAGGIDAVQGAREALPDADAVDDLHGERGDVQLRDHLPLRRVHVPYADEGDTVGIEAGE